MQRPGGLVGRERELDELARLLVRAEDGSGALALLVGEPGIGKTSLLEAAAAQATARGFTVAWGRAWEVGGAPAYWPWIEALRALAAGGAAATAALARLSPGAAAAGAGDPFQVHDAVVAALAEVTERAPLLLVLDDLHAADPSSLQLAELVARQLRRLPMALLGSHRDVEARRTPELEASLARLARGGAALPLRRLARAEVGQLVREMIGRDDAEAARMIHDASDGNPLFVRELLQLLAARGGGAGGASGVPAGVRAVIRERLALLSPATVALLQAAAVVGREFGVTVAAEVAGVTAAALEEAAGEALGAELLLDAGPGQLRFSHALVAETLAADLAPAVRARLHRRAAETLAARHPAGDPTSPADQIAHHLLNAGQQAAPEALAACERAATAAATRLAFADAAMHLERAIALLEQQAPGDLRRRAELCVRRTQALAMTLDLARAEQSCRTAAELARSLADPELLASAALAMGAEVTVSVVNPTLIVLLEEALAALPPADGALRARVAARLAAAQQPADDPGGPMSMAREAIAMARRLGDDAVLGEVLFSAMGAMMDFAPAGERAPLNLEAARRAEASGERPRRLRSLMRLAFDRLQLSDIDGFTEAVAQYRRLGEATAQPRYQWAPLMFDAMRADWEGRYRDSEALMAQATALRERAGEPWDQSFLSARAMTLGALRHDLAAVERGLDNLTLLMQRSPEFGQMVRAWGAALLGWREEAKAFADRLLTVGSPRMAHDVHVHRLAGECMWSARHRGLAELLLPTLERYAGQPSMMTGVGFVVTGFVDHVRMRAAAVLQQWVRVDQLAEQVLAQCARWNARPFEVRVRLDWAEALLDRGGAAAAAKAREQWLAALAVAEQLEDAPGLAQLCRDFAARFDGARQPEPAPAASAAIATVATDAPVRLTLEGEFWTVSGLGELCRIKDSRGMRMLARLIDAPGQELHVLDLSGEGEAVAGESAVDGGDAGEVIDREARAAYQARVRELREELAEAAAWNDAGRRERLEAELEAITAELAGAVGLGGRERRSGGAVERARSNVRRRIADALRRIEEACPKLGRHLERAVKTGIYCSYQATL